VNEHLWIDIAPGIRRRTVTHGASMYQMMAKLDAGSRMPEHKHPQEQIVHILEGRMKLIVSGVPHELKGGESFYLAGNVPHSVETIEDTMVLDTFSPPRDDYLALDQQAVTPASRNVHGNKYLCCTSSGQLSLVLSLAGSLRSSTPAPSILAFGKPL
jgi:quercetin dioxygenase-like cupin family protein